MSGASFRIGGIPVRIDLTFLLIAVFLGWGARTGGLLVAWVAIVTGSVLLHELGHAVAFRRYGQQPSILLQGMGGLTSGSGEPLSPRRDIVVSLAGPLSGLVLIGLPALVIARSQAELSPTWETVLADLVFVNLAWSVVNLLPILPLDGGRVSAALWALGTGGRGEHPAHVLSALVAGAGVVLAMSAGYTFGALFAGFFCAYNVAQLTRARNERLQDRLVEGWRSLLGENPAAAGTAAEEVLGDRPSGPVMGQASQLLAWSRLATGDVDGARAAVARLPHGMVPDGFLQAALDLGAGLRDEALDHLERVYSEGVASPGAPLLAAAVADAGLTDALAQRLLRSGEPGSSPAALFAVHLHAGGRFEEATEVGQRALEAGTADPARVAYNLACSQARAGHMAAALDWLERAAGEGFDDVELLDADPDL
ncbi:MAG: hypothetical protein LC799_20810, partial [Actinobacteria bacterium]|nr:hypothetical protein [Actinomycetota bacterium]